MQPVPAGSNVRSMVAGRVADGRGRHKAARMVPVPAHAPERGGAAAPPGRALPAGERGQHGAAAALPTPAGALPGLRGACAQARSCRASPSNPQRGAPGSAVPAVGCGQCGAAAALPASTNALPWTGLRGAGALARTFPSIPAILVPELLTVLFCGVHACDMAIRLPIRLLASCLTLEAWR